MIRAPRCGLGESSASLSHHPSSSVWTGDVSLGPLRCPASTHPGQALGLLSCSCCWSLSRAARARAQLRELGNSWEPGLLSADHCQLLGPLRARLCGALAFTQKGLRTEKGPWQPALEGP